MAAIVQTTLEEALEAWRVCTDEFDCEEKTKRLTEESRSGRLLRTRAITIAYQTSVYGASWEHVL